MSIRSLETVLSSLSGTRRRKIQDRANFLSAKTENTNGRNGRKVRLSMGVIVWLAALIGLSLIPSMLIQAIMLTILSMIFLTFLYTQIRREIDPLVATFSNVSQTSSSSTARSSTASSISETKRNNSEALTLDFQKIADTLVVSTSVQLGPAGSLARKTLTEKVATLKTLPPDIEEYSSPTQVSYSDTSILNKPRATLSPIFQETRFISMLTEAEMYIPTLLASYGQNFLGPAILKRIKQLPNVYQNGTTLKVTISASKPNVFSMEVTLD